MDRYKIAFVLDDSLDTPDGVQQYMLTVGQWFVKQGHEVHYLVGETLRTDVPNIHSLGRNVKVRFNHNRMSIPLPVSRRRIKRLLTEQEFDIIHVQMPFSPMLAGRIIKAASPQTAVVGTFHIAPHSRVVYWGTLILRQITRGAVMRLDEIISVSKVAQDFAWKTYAIETSIVPNTLDLHAFYNAKPFNEYRQTKNIVFLGRLVERKGCGYLLRAIKRLHDARALPDDCRVIICGGGPLEAELKAYAAQHGLNKLVRFVASLARPTSRAIWRVPIWRCIPAPAARASALSCWKAWRPAAAWYWLVTILATPALSVSGRWPYLTLLTKSNLPASYSIFWKTPQPGRRPYCGSSNLSDLLMSPVWPTRSALSTSKHCISDEHRR